MVLRCRSTFVSQFKMDYCREEFVVMKKVLLLAFAWCVAFAAYAQEFPYSKYLHFTKEQFKENKFKYHKKDNVWSLNKISGLNTTLNVLAFLVDAYDDIRPAVNDYYIAAQLGKDDKVASLEVYFYDDNIYHKLLTFLKDNGQHLLETSSGKLIKYQAYYDGYALELNMEQHIVSRSSSYTADSRTIKNVDESYNEYQFVIRTDIEPWSTRIDKHAAKQDKRDAKGKKKRSVEELM